MATLATFKPVASQPAWKFMLLYKEDYLFLPLSLRRINQRPTKSLYFPI